MFADIKQPILEFIDRNKFEELFDDLLLSADNTATRYDRIFSNSQTANEILDFVISQPNFPISEMIRIANDELKHYESRRYSTVQGSLILMSVLSHPNLPSEYIGEIYPLNNDQKFRSLLLSHPNIPISLLHSELKLKNGIAESDSQYLSILESAISNPSLPREYLVSTFSIEFMKKHGTQIFYKALLNEDLSPEFFYIFLDPDASNAREQKLLVSRIIAHSQCPVDVSSALYPLVENASSVYGLDTETKAHLEEKYTKALEELGFEHSTASVLPFGMKAKLLASDKADF